MISFFKLKVASRIRWFLTKFQKCPLPPPGPISHNTPPSKERRCKSGFSTNLNLPSSIETHSSLRLSSLYNKRMFIMLFVLHHQSCLLPARNLLSYQARPHFVCEHTPLRECVVKGRTCIKWMEGTLSSLLIPSCLMSCIAHIGWFVKAKLVFISSIYG